MPELTFSTTVALETVKGLQSQTAALQACGMQPEFAAQLMLQSRIFNTCIILRAGSPPVYNQHRGPKSGINLTKTSNQGFFKGSLAENPLFTRVTHRANDNSYHNIGHHSKDAAHLTLAPKSGDYQHRVQLPVTMQDILREIGPNGDLEVLGYHAETGQLRFGYKPGKGDSDFKGQFVLKINEGNGEPQFFSRPWDRPENDPNWDNVNQIIRKPAALAQIPDKLYKKIFNQQFGIYYTDTKIENPSNTDIKVANVFANTPRSASDFLDIMGTEHPRYDEVKKFSELQDILNVLSEPEIVAIYDKSALIVTGDWDGLAIGHPPDISPKFRQVYNTFDTKKSQGEMSDLLQSTFRYFTYLQEQSKQKKASERKPFDNVLLSISHPINIISEFALQRAGCITPHEFLFQQILNYTYRLETNEFYGEKRLMSSLQIAMDESLSSFGKIKGEYSNANENKKTTMIEAIFQRTLANYHTALAADPKGLPNPALLELLDEHLKKHFQIAITKQQSSYTIPHPSYDHNTNDLFQHGFDMRNPYGSNLEGPWFMVTPNGGLLYGSTQEQLVEVMLIGDFLKNNLIDVNFAADMSAGWGKIIAKQLELGQTIPEKTLQSYSTYIAKEIESHQKHTRHGTKTDSQFTEKFRRIKANFHEEKNNLQQNNDNIHDDKKPQR